MVNSKWQGAPLVQTLSHAPGWGHCFSSHGSGRINNLTGESGPPRLAIRGPLPGNEDRDEMRWKLADRLRHRQNKYLTAVSS